MYLKDILDKKQKQVSFHMPGHKENYSIFEKDILHYDITEYDCYDNLSNPQGAIKNSLDRIRRLYGSEYSFILVNGSTVGILASLFYANTLGGEILAYRNSHKSFFNGVSLTGQNVSYFNPIINQNGFICNLDYTDISNKIKQNSNITSLFVTSPTYEGVFFDIKKLSEICHENNVILIVDEAHGAHFPFSDNFPTSAIKYSDIVINSMHKTLPALTQTALLHTTNKHKEELHRYINMLQTSSPSYLFMYAIDTLFNDIENNKLDFTIYYENILSLRKKLKTLKNIHLLDIDNIDKTRITLYSDILTGEKLNDLLKKQNIYCEMYLDNYIVLITSICDTVHDYNYLFEELEKIDKNTHQNIDKKHNTLYTNNKTLNIDTKFTIKNTMYLPYKKLDIRECENMVVKDFIIPYPPGVPLLLPGEVISSEMIDKILYLVSQKVEVIGIDNYRINIIEGVNFY